MHLILLLLSALSVLCRPEDHLTGKTPKIYGMEDYFECMKDGGVFCTTEIKVESVNSDSITWKTIQSRNNSNYDYDHSILYRAICIPLERSKNHQSMTEFAEEKIAKELHGYELKPAVYKVKCKNETFEFSTYDTGLLTLICVYLFFIAFASIYHKMIQNTPKQNRTKMQNFFTFFSLITNWNRIFSARMNEDFHRLKSIQGIRFFNTMLVIMCHVKLTYAQTYLENTDQIENAHRNFFFNLWTGLDLLLVQTNFFISSLLLTNQINEIYLNKGFLSLRDCFLLILNRYFRFLPTLLLAVALMRSNFLKIVYSPITFEVIHMTRVACRKNWWSTLLLMTYLHDFGDMCNPGTWYLSIDTLFYLVTVVTFYVVFKLRLNVLKVLFGLLVGSCCYYGTVIYKNDLNPMIRLSPEFAKRDHFFYSPDLHTQYLSFQSSWSSSIVGTILGVFYFRSKRKHTELTKCKKFLWAACFLFLPIFSLTTVAEPLKYTGLEAATLGAVIKPLFSLGIGIGVLGMSKGIGGIVKRICEWNFAVKFSNFTFVTYLAHFLIVFPKGATSYSPFSFGFFVLCKSIVFDVVASFSVGIFITLILEQPGIRLQKRLLPQIRRKITQKTS